jgi:hypothetical protein
MSNRRFRFPNLTFCCYSAKVDKYGRKLKEKKGEDLRKYYRLSKDGEAAPSGSKEDQVLEDEEDSEEAEEPKEKEWDRARGEGPMYSSSEEESEEEEEDLEEPLSSDEEGSLRGGADDLVDFEEDDIYDRIGPFATEEIPMGDAARRLAVVNMDWDNVRAKDLFKILHSFAPVGGKVTSVKVFPSEFGKERLAHEAIHGPPAEIFGGSAEAADGEDAEEGGESLVPKDDSGEEFDNEKLRLYQLERLRYYYAIVECDSIATAKTIYEACDGTEYEKTSNFFDIRYVPDEEEFTDEPRDSTLENPTAYKPVDFVTKALQHSKVELTWDQDSAERIKTTRRKFTKDDLAEMDFQAYLGSDSESEEDEDKKKKYREMLLGGTNDEEEAEDMEITFQPGLEGKVQTLVEKKLDTKDGKKKDKKKQQKKKQDSDSEDEEEQFEAGEGTGEDGGPDLGFDDPFFLEAENPKRAKKLMKEQKKEGKKRRNEPDPEKEKEKAELELLLADETGQHSKHFEMKEVIKNEKKARRRGKKNKKGEEPPADTFEIDVADSRFAPMLSSNAFAIDTTSAQFKETTNMRKLLAARKPGAEGSTVSLLARRFVFGVV